MGYDLQQGQRPVLIDDSVYRSGDILQILPSKNIVDTVPQLSEACQV